RPKSECKGCGSPSLDARRTATQDAPDRSDGFFRGEGHGTRRGLTASRRICSGYFFILWRLLDVGKMTISWQKFSENQADTLARKPSGNVISSFFAYSSA